MLGCSRWLRLWTYMLRNSYKICRHYLQLSTKEKIRSNKAKIKNNKVKIRSNEAKKSYKLQVTSYNLQVTS